MKFCDWLEPTATTTGLPDNFLNRESKGGLGGYRSLGPLLRFQYYKIDAQKRSRIYEILELH